METHRVIWAWCFGEWPRCEIDHLDVDHWNNRLGNLRDVPRLLNIQNIRQAKKHSKSGFLGVHSRGGGFAAQVQADGKAVWLGTYATPEEAHQVYIAAKRQLHEGNTL